MRSRAPETPRSGQGEPRAPLIAARLDFHKVGTVSCHVEGHDRDHVARHRASVMKGQVP